MNGLHPDNRPIGVFDSGIGGLTVANAIFRTLPSESLIYFGDTARVPYGPRPPETIQRFSIEISRFLMDQGAKVIVVACNTASASALSVLRETWPGFPFVGMEPAVKPAAKATRTGVIGVLATEGTFKSQRYAGLMDQYAAGIRVFEDPCLGLVPLIESGKWEAPETEALITSIIRPMLAGGADIDTASYAGSALGVTVDLTVVGAQGGVAVAVGDVGAGRRQVVGGDQGLLDHVLDLLDARRLAMEAVDEHLAHLGGQQGGFVGRKFAGGGTCALDGRADLAGVKRGALCAALDDLAGQGGDRGIHGRLHRWNAIKHYI